NEPRGRPQTSLRNYEKILSPRLGPALEVLGYSHPSLRDAKQVLADAFCAFGQLRATSPVRGWVLWPVFARASGGQAMRLLLPLFAGFRRVAPCRMVTNRPGRHGGRDWEISLSRFYRSASSAAC